MSPAKGVLNIVIIPLSSSISNMNYLKNPKIREVYGVDNLIIADASVLPTQVDGNTSAATYIVANIIANELLWKKKV
jgi:hypothetical protein